ncbi:MAG: sugar phosphate nucleotidyltransferase [Candidatus Brocadiales bacterium]
MKGVVLAGGLGTRLDPLTKVTNKHLLPVYDKPMIYYPLKTLADAGIRDIMVVTGGLNAGDFLKLLGNGKAFGLKKLHYAYQEGEGGIAEALALAEDFTDGGPVAVILGDNIFEKNLGVYVRAFLEQERSARLVLARVSGPEKFGVARFNPPAPFLPGAEGTAGRLVEIVEKPEIAPSDYAVTGFYMYDSDVFDIIGGLKPSERGELEITDVNNTYLRAGELEYSILDGWWIDAGSSPLNLARATRLVMTREGVYSGCGCRINEEELDVCVV